MNSSDIIKYRLINQQIIQAKFKKPEELVAWMAAMQAQDFPMAKWAIGLRLPGWKDLDIEKVFNEGKILRTHLLRPTWHFVNAEDIRWMLELTAPRILSSLAHNYRSFGWDKKFFKKTNHLLSRVLQGGNHLTRDELRQVFKKAKIATDGLRLIHLLAHAELDRIICSGAKIGKQFTYALLDERAPEAKSLDREVALTELTKRYFSSHGPATLHDFAWWSGLSITEAKKGIESVKKDFLKDVIDGKEYFFEASGFKDDVIQSTHLLPNFDEYTVAYKDRSFMMDKKHFPKVGSSANPVFSNAILINGKIEGTWKRIIKKDSVAVRTQPFLVFSKTKQQAIITAIKKYSEFVGHDNNS